MKNKLVLIGICFVIIIGIFVRNVGIQLKNFDNEKKGNTNQASILTSGDQVTRAEVAKMLSFLFYSETESSNLTRVISYKDSTINDWYDEYINAIKSVGFLEKSQDKKMKYRPKEFLTYEECKSLLEEFIKICNREDNDSPLKYEELAKGLNFSFNEKKMDQPILASEWLSVYDNMLRQMKTISEQITAKLGNTEDNFFDHSLKVQEKNLYIVGIDKAGKDTSYAATITDDKIYSSKGIKLDNMIDSSVNAYISEDEIICVKKQIKEEITLSNVWIASNKDKKISAFINGYEKTFYAENELSKEVKQVIGDLIIKDKKVVKIKIKPDIISGKVLVATDKYIELEDYGKITLEDNYKIYKLYNGLSMELTNSILVGYKNADFVISDGKICAVLIKDNIKAENIRVLIKTSNFSSLFHKEIKLTATSDFQVIYGKKKNSYKAGKTITINASSDLLKSGRLKIQSTKADSKIKILSINRSDGHPEYRGSMEIATYDDGLILINELPLEEYLYSVVPSEMPTTYGTEALKVQAICARSYAYNQLVGNSYSTYGAHVDDSSSYQVYNNYSETKESILAVKDTYGKVIEYNHNIILAYYFSTSCGYTTSAKDVWGASGELKYLAGRLQSDKEESLNLSEEKSFRKFILNDDIKTYDKQFPWYRWKTTISSVNLQKTIEANITKRYNANPKLILTQVKEGGNEEFKSVPINSIGEVKDIQVASRGTGGIITELLVRGSKNTIKIITEYNIRLLLAPIYDDIIRQDDTKVSNLSMLPSAFFVIDANKKNGKIDAFTFSGGGYGHGVGMSQNGVKAMTEAGKTYEQILKYYYTGTELAYIYK